MHRKVNHGYRDPINALVDSVLCRICLLHIHDCIRLFNDIKYRSHICRLNLLIVGPTVSIERSDELDLACHGLRRTRFVTGLRAYAAVWPVFCLQGPLLPAPLLSVLPLLRRIHVLGNGGRHYG